MAVFSAGNALLALTSAIVLYATYLGTKEAKWSVYVAAALSLVIAIHQMVSFFFNMELRRRFSRKSERPPNAIATPGDQVLMPAAATGELVGSPSVTEKTTELLEGSPRARGDFEAGEKTVR